MQKKPQSRLLLVSGTGDSPKLAESIYRELRDSYQMRDSVQILTPRRPDKVDVNIIKNRTYPLVVGMFQDSETRVDVGRNELLDEIRGKHIAIIKYMYTPKRFPHMHVNDHMQEVKALLDVIKHTDTLKRTLVAPYLPYLRSHSNEKYEKRGFYQYDSLTDMVESFSRKGLDGIICIDPHSDKIVEKGREYSINVNVIDPFQSSSHINPYKLGLNSTAEKVLLQLQPFLEHFIRKKEELKDKKFVFISLDGGTERRTEQFLINGGLGWDDIMYMVKLRDSLGKPIFSIKGFSKINESSLDKNSVYILPDDIIDSGGSAEGVARLLKSKGVKQVELWCTHAVVPDRKKIEDLTQLDKILTLDTILHENPEEIHIEYLNASSHLLAAEIFKAHMRLEEERSTV
ncbi:ribose-phosphate pyrophosphokinase [Candidatus Woesearchaeota archaeon]|nr:ribose-phosphate pyrophosphokinase [Candidatus Woesearchaeota archaeon]